MRVSSLGDVWAHSGPGPGHGLPAKQGGLLGLDQMVEAGAGARGRARREAEGDGPPRSGPASGPPFSFCLRIRTGGPPFGRFGTRSM